MKGRKYLPRICDEMLQRKLKSSGAVLVEGAKWCGKTSTALQSARSALYLQDQDHAGVYQAMADTKPSLLLQGETPRLIDEWQTIPVLWDAVRFAVDQRGEWGQFLLTGSAVPVDGVTQHSGTGRISRLLMRPMSLFESQDSIGTVSLGELFNGNVDIASANEMTLEQLAFVICRGGWPATVGMDAKAAIDVAYQYVESIINMDVQRVDGMEKNPQRVRTLLRSLARNLSTLATAKTIMEDVRANDVSITDKTLASYLNALRRMFVVEDVQAWQPSLRSKTAIRSAYKREMVDPSLAAATLNLTPNTLLRDFELFGFFFESLCVRDMRIYAQAGGGDIFHYRDKSGLEADMVIRLHDGRWAAVEVKLGVSQIEVAARNLLALREKVNTTLVGEPAFLMVLTGGQYAYRRKDGVLVVPIGCMRH